MALKKMLSIIDTLDKKSEALLESKALALANYNKSESLESKALEPVTK